MPANVNELTRLLPHHLRLPTWRRATLIDIALFYGFFVTLSLRGLGRAARGGRSAVASDVVRR
jgi:hypothetical protein